MEDEKTDETRAAEPTSDETTEETHAPGPDKGDGRDQDADPTADGEAAKWKATSRKWEDRAKQNHESLEKLSKQLEETQKAYEAVKAEYDAQKAAGERAAMLSAVAERAGIPASLLSSCSTEEEAEALSRTLVEWAGKKEYPTDKGGAPAGKSPISRQQIADIKDPIARLRATAENIGLYRD